MSLGRGLKGSGPAGGLSAAQVGKPGRTCEGAWAGAWGVGRRDRILVPWDLDLL